MKREKIKKLLSEKPVGTDVLIKGWVRTKRDNKSIVFIAINDGSTINNIQVVVNPSDFDEKILKEITTEHALLYQENLLNRMARDRKLRSMPRGLNFMARPMQKPILCRKKDIRWSSSVK